MLDLIIYFILKYTYIPTALLFAVKIVLFLKHRNRNWTFLEFLYFNDVNIKFTSSNERANLKRMQNALSILILILLVLQITTLVIFG